MANIYEMAAAQLAAGQCVALTEIIEHKGSTPRETGARMLVSAGGQIVDTIGGGRLEAMAVLAGQEGIRRKRGKVVPFSLSGQDAAETEMICGGSGTLLITPLGLEDLPALTRGAAAIKARKRAWLVTLLEQGEAYTAFIGDDREVFCGRSCTARQKSLLLAGIEAGGHTQEVGEALIHVRLLTPGPLLYLFGGGHIGKETADLCHGIGFETVVIDDRVEYANPVRFPHARCLVAESPADLPALTLDEETYILIMTRGHLLDHVWLAWAMALPVMPKYIGMIGSRRKTAMVVERLVQAGVAQERITQLHSPVGMAIGAQTPAEIAVSIGAQLIQVRNGRHSE